LTLIFVRISPIACRPSTNLPALYHIAHHSQQWVTPELGLNSTRVKIFLTGLKAHGQQERLHPRLQQQARQEVSEPCSYSLAPSGNQFPNNSLIQREIDHGPNNPPLQYPTGLTTYFFSPTPKLIGTQTDISSDTGSGTMKGRYGGQLPE
jgi:hypothetical protein